MMMKNILKTVTSSQKRDCCADEQEHWHLIRGKILCIYQQVWAHFLMLTLRFILEFAWAAYTTLATNEKPVPGSLPVGGANATVAKNETNMDADKAYQGWTHLFFLGLLWILFLYAWTLSLWNLLMLRKLWRWHPNRERALLPGVIRSLQQAYLPLLITMILCGVVLLPSIALYGCNWKSGIDSKGSLLFLFQGAVLS
ncbi:uncharacterized protein LOC129594675 [Paramacrobiotus metropolitanus]|uniref:uncharacterized protein LOC129594675 n=1 Tax=Paramacrobiotus metropolitanus TaxID=2943436 RepID=UPI00244562CD|nr:uncharacterized protein LOC129594675 [Paramacrobiotus metropolitanus]